MSTSQAPELVIRAQPNPRRPKRGQLYSPAGEQLLALGDDLEQLWDHPDASVSLKKRILRTVLQEIMAYTTEDPPAVHLKLHWIGGSHTELTVRKNKVGYHNHINSEEVTELIRELALVCEDSAIISILNRSGYRTGNNKIWTEKRVQHVRHMKGYPACSPPNFPPSTEPFASSTWASDLHFSTPAMRKPL